MIDVEQVLADTANPRLPRNPIGYVDDATYDGILHDALEHIGDLQWPLSVNTYRLMRRDPKLAAVEAGYCLQLRRAQWQVDGTGCRPEVVQLVADDLGLPVKGHDDPGPARTRAVSWNEHLRVALTMLVFGHAGFEIQAELVDGKARLVGLWERPQNTISQIHADPKTGEFEGISQELGRQFSTPQIPADRMVWYAHQREGAGWWGTSILRPAYAPWLLKREMQRVLATSSRRFGMGVPTIEWAQGAAPSPEQMTAAQRAVVAARVGDQAGLSLPPGAMLRLVGLSGGVPQTLEFIRWLDQQMSTMALMGHLDLGQTATGSRALGETFVDAFLLALESVGEHVADVATRQIAARLVEWNWGGDEPVPRVVVSGVGSRREVTAETLQLLLSSGALSADPELEEWVRREFRLPERAEAEPSPGGRAAARETRTPPGGDRGDNEDDGDGGAGGGRRVDATPPAGRWEQPELPILAQTTTGGDHGDEGGDDEGAGEDTAAAAALAALLTAWPLLAAPLTTTLATQAAAATAAGALTDPAALTVPADVTAAITRRVAADMAGVAATAARLAVAELARQGVTVPTPTVDRDLVDEHVRATAGLLVGGYRSTAAHTAAQYVGVGDQATVTAAVTRALDELTATTARPGGRGGRGLVAGLLSALIHTVQHVGRVAVYRALEALGARVEWWADESHEDPNRCAACAAANGRTYRTLDAALAEYPAGKNIHCAGRQRCRGRLRARVLAPGQVDAAAAARDRVERLVAAGATVADAYQAVHQLPQVTATSVADLEQAAGPETMAALRRGYAEHVWMQYLAAVDATGGQLLTAQAAAAGVAPVSLFSGPHQRAYQWASPELKAFWDTDRRFTFPEWVDYVLAADHWRHQPRDDHGRWTDKPGGSLPDLPDVDLTPPAGEAARTPSGLPTAGHLLDLADRYVNGDAETAEQAQQQLVAAAAAVFDGRFAGLRTEADKVFIHPGGQLDISGSIYSDEDEGRGVFELVLYRDDEGRPAVRHQMLFLSPNLQGRGFATEFNAHREQWYRESGIQYITLTAGLDIGGYAWAAAGYEFADEAGAYKVAERLVETIRRYEQRAAEERRRAFTLQGADRVEALARADVLDYQVEEGWRLLGRVGVDRRAPEADLEYASHELLGLDAPKPVDIALLGRPPGASPDDLWLGKEALLWSEWEAVKWL